MVSTKFMHNPLMEPIFFTPPGSKRLYMGGGGGGSGDKYASLEELYKEQAESARLLREQAQANLPDAVNSYVGETKEVLNPGYAEQQAALVGSDMASAGAKESAATTRTLESMGVNPNDPRFVGTLRTTELNNAAKVAAGKNIARTDANKYQLNVAKDAVGTFTGQNNNAASLTGGAASGLASLYSTQNQQNLQQQQLQSQNTANMVGAGIGLMAKKDGGRVCAPKGIQRHKNGGKARKLERFFFGGVTGGSQRGFLSTAPTQPTTMPTQAQQSSSPLMQGIQTGRLLGRGISNVAGRVQGMQAGAGMNAEQTAAASDAYNAAAQAATDPAQKKAYEQAATDITRGNKWFGSSESAPISEATQAAGADAATTAAAGNAAEAAGAAGLTSAETAAGAAAANAAATGAAEGAIGAAAGEAAGATAAGALGGAGAAIGTALPWVGAALAAGKLLGAFANGGDVKAQDFRTKGGDVSGPGGPTDDLVPSLLSDGEFVMTAEATALHGDKLKQMNDEGLALRKKGYTPGQIKASGFGIQRRAA